MNALAKTGFLVFFVSLCATAGFFSHDFRQRMVPAPAPRELYSIVNNQLAAFRADDFPRAYQHAAANVHQKFSLAQFETLIRNDYATMTHAERVEFGMVRVEDETAVVPVLFCSADGTIRSFLYSLVAEDHTWKIDGRRTTEYPPARTSYFRAPPLNLAIKRERLRAGSSLHLPAAGCSDRALQQGLGQILQIGWQCPPDTISPAKQNRIAKRPEGAISRRPVKSHCWISKRECLTSNSPTTFRSFGSRSSKSMQRSASSMWRCRGLPSAASRFQSKTR